MFHDHGSLISLITFAMQPSSADHGTPPLTLVAMLYAGYVAGRGYAREIACNQRHMQIKQQ